VLTLNGKDRPILGKTLYWGDYVVGVAGGFLRFPVPVPLCHAKPWDTPALLNYKQNLNAESCTKVKTSSEADGSPPQCEFCVLDSASISLYLGWNSLQQNFFDDQATLEGKAQPPAFGALIFTCNGRGVNLYGEPNYDSATLASYVPVPMSGFFCNGLSKPFLTVPLPTTNLAESTMILHLDMLMLHFNGFLHACCQGLW